VLSLAEANQASENRQPKPPPIFSKVIPEKAESEVASEIAGRHGCALSITPPAGKLLPRDDFGPTTGDAERGEL
jgi:hypothetical protein